MPSNAPAMPKAGSITSSGWPRLLPGATRALTLGTAALDERTPTALVLVPGPRATPDNRPSRALSAANCRSTAVAYLTETAPAHPPAAISSEMRHEHDGEKD